MLDFLDSASFWRDVRDMEAEAILQAQGEDNTVEIRAFAYDSDGETDSEDEDRWEE